VDGECRAGLVGNLGHDLVQVRTSPLLSGVTDMVGCWLVGTLRLPDDATVQAVGRERLTKFHALVGLEFEHGRLSVSSLDERYARELDRLLRLAASGPGKSHPAPTRWCRSVDVQSVSMTSPSC
jgi:hypothetical protein